MRLELSKSEIGDLSLGLTLEWLETNGMGGYASGTIYNQQTRKYHSLLAASLELPPGKFNLLSNLSEALQIDDQHYPLDADHLENFSQDLYPIWEFELDDQHGLRRELLLLHKANAVLIKYTLTGPKPVGAHLKISPLLAYRDIHGLMHQNGYCRPQTHPCPDGFSISPYEGMPTLYCQMSGRHALLASHQWQRGFEYIEEANRGYPNEEDLFSIGEISLSLAREDSFIVAFSTEQQKEKLPLLWEREVKRREKLYSRCQDRAPKPENAGNNEDWITNLRYRALQFIDERSSGSTTIIAGYPWFLAWGRDAMISLPGLTLCCGRNDMALEILKTFSNQMQDGLIPNFISATPNNNAYNTVDSSLWFGWAVQQYLAFTHDYSSVKDLLWPNLKAILFHYTHGTSYHIHSERSDLLFAGSPEHQLTWMDAKAYGQPVTPRWGYAVEINALWYNFVHFMMELAKEWNDPIAKDLQQRFSGLQEIFINMFWLPIDEHLCDCVNATGKDRSMRPNQIFAASLPHSPLTKKQSRELLLHVKEELLTPRGLRTLSPNNPNYQGQCVGNPEQRDLAYHNGTVWPWLLGHYAEAVLKSSDDKNKSVIELEQLLTDFRPHLKEAGLGTISEIFDGNAPYYPRGCIAQAWSVAETIRLSHLLSQARIAIGSTDKLRPLRREKVASLLRRDEIKNKSIS